MTDIYLANCYFCKSKTASGMMACKKCFQKLLSELRDVKKRALAQKGFIDVFCRKCNEYIPGRKHEVADAVCFDCYKEKKRLRNVELKGENKKAN